MNIFLSNFDIKASRVHCTWEYKNRKETEATDHEKSVAQVCRLGTMINKL